MRRESVHTQEGMPMFGFNHTTALLLFASLTAATQSKSEESAMYAVMVEFNVAEEQTEAVVSTVAGLLTELVRHQKGFVEARLNRQTDGPKVVNYMLWENGDAFAAFRSENKDRIGQAIGQYGPTFTFYEVAKSVDAAQ